MDEKEKETAGGVASVTASSPPPGFIPALHAS